MNEADRNEMIKYKLSLGLNRDLQSSPESPEKPEKPEPKARVKTAPGKRSNYSYVDNLVMRVRLNALKNETKAKELEQ